MTMSQLRPEGRMAGGEINVTVAPSVRISDPRLGVYVHVNDHFAIDTAAAGTAERVVTLLEENFDASLKRSEQIVDHIMSLATNQES